MPMPLCIHQSKGISVPKRFSVFNTRDASDLPCDEKYAIRLQNLSSTPLIVYCINTDNTHCLSTPATKQATESVRFTV